MYIESQNLMVIVFILPRVMKQLVFTALFKP